MVKSLVFLVLFCSSLSYAEITPEEYKDEVEIHIETILDMSESGEVWSYFVGSINPAILRQYLLLHDRPKLMPLDVLRVYNFQGDEPIYTTFARFFGRNFGSLSPSEQLVLHNAKAELDRIERLLKAEFFERLSLTEEEVYTLRRLELVLDITATGISRRVELNIDFQGPYYGEHWFLSRDMPIEARLSRLLEDEFVNIMTRESFLRATPFFQNCINALSGPGPIGE